MLMGIEDLGSGEAALIMEDNKNHFLAFLRLDLYEDDKLATKVRTGLNQIEPSYRPETDLENYASPVVKVKSVIVAMDDDFNPLQEEMHYAVALRQDGTLDFYCNFTYVSSFDHKDFADQKLHKNDTEKKNVGKVDEFDLDFSRIYLKTTEGFHFSVDLTW